MKSGFRAKYLLSGLLICGSCGTHYVLADARSDPDMEPDEIQAVIDRAEQKRQHIADRQPAAKASARILVMLSRAAEFYRREIADGLAGNELAVLKARMILREILGTVRLNAGEGGALFKKRRIFHEWMRWFGVRRRGHPEGPTNLVATESLGLPEQGRKMLKRFLT